MRRSFCIAFLALLPAIPALAQPPAPIDPARDNFPGGFTSPASGASSGFALADRWLADEPFANPAIAARGRISVTPIFVHVSRQDLRADNRTFDDQGATIDFAGAWMALPIRMLALSGYFWQPVLRFEDNSYDVGTEVSVGPPARLTMQVTAREWIAGLGVSAPLGRTRVGAALEWTGRSDSYSTHEESGSPSAGDQSVDFSGDAIGGQLGAHTAFGASERPLELGIAARYRPSLDLTGTQQLNLLSGSSTAEVSASRAAAWEGGASLRMPLGESFRLILAGGGTTRAQDWTGFGVSTGQSAEWKIAGEYHDGRDPWTFRFGGGQEQQNNVPEPRAGVYAAGLGWRFKHASADLALTHRTLDRPGEPNSYDERVLLSLSVP
ncbi:MAG: hypothetical protein ACRENS_06370 [Candidatus Eiseniibacteriota bacterium]